MDLPFITDHFSGDHGGFCKTHHASRLCRPLGYSSRKVLPLDLTGSDGQALGKRGGDAPPYLTSSITCSTRSKGRKHR